MIGVSQRFSFLLSKRFQACSPYHNTHHQNICLSDSGKHHVARSVGALGQHGEVEDKCLVSQVTKWCSRLQMFYSWGSRYKAGTEMTWGHETWSSVRGVSCLPWGDDLLSLYDSDPRWIVSCVSVSVTCCRCALLMGVNLYVYVSLRCTTCLILVLWQLLFLSLSFFVVANEHFCQVIISN